LPALQNRLGELHPYELPELLVLSVEGGGDAYLEWARRAVR
jgi:periplasmic divalent cation tolerance protein